MFDFLILTSLVGVIGAISAIIRERKRHAVAKKKLKEFEKTSPPNKGTKRAMH